MAKTYFLPNVPPTKFDELNPSEVTETAWIHAFRAKGTYYNATANSGKWLVFIDISEIDNVWKKIKKATEEGKLGNNSKVATNSSEGLKNKNDRVICVYTYNFDDINDIIRIREELRNLGVIKKIPYKLDFETREGNFHTSSMSL